MEKQCEMWSTKFLKNCSLDWPRLLHMQLSGHGLFFQWKPQLLLRSIFHYWCTMCNVNITGKNSYVLKILVEVTCSRSKGFQRGALNCISTSVIALHCVTHWLGTLFWSHKGLTFFLFCWCQFLPKKVLLYSIMGILPKRTSLVKNVILK